MNEEAGPPAAGGRDVENSLTFSVRTRFQIEKRGMMLLDTDANVVYLSLWLKAEYPDVYADLIRILHENAVDYSLIPDTAVKTHIITPRETRIRWYNSMPLMYW